MKILSLFDGISCARVALERVWINVDMYYASEIDKYAIQIAQKNYPDTIQIGDVKNVDGMKYDIDLLIGGSPCQDLSIAKKDRKGLDGERSGLFWEYVRILKESNPKYFILENVASMSKEDEDVITKTLKVKPNLINADLFVPQNRPRKFWTNIKVGELPNRPEWNKEMYQWRRNHFRENKNGVCPCLTANMGTGGHNVPLKSKDLKDKLTPIECERLQGLPDNHTEGLSNTKRYKCLGNAFNVDVVAHILKKMKQD